ncbi:hypothetical protein Btru_016122 [Bulinus truncatus]|nr:hypothetical protein Btru_016122 [Bulinus truncatus]
MELTRNKLKKLISSALFPLLKTEQMSKLTLELYTDITFETQVTMIGGTYLVEVGDWINAAIVMHSNDQRLKVVTVDCDALPVLPMATTVPVEKLIHNKCPSHPSLSMYELDNFKQGFRFQAIMFSGYSMTYIKCTATVCLSNSQSCARMCQSPDRRRRRDTSDTNAVDKQIQSFNILLYDQQTQDFQKLKSQILSDLVESTPDQAPVDVHHLSVDNGQTDLSRASGLQADELQIANTLSGKGSAANSLHLNCLLLLFSTLTLIDISYIFILECSVLFCSVN